MSWIRKGGYTIDAVTGNKYWKTKALIKFDMYRMDTREDLIKAGYDMEELDRYQGLKFSITKQQFHNWNAIQAICGMLFIENDAGMNDYHNYVICKLAKNFSLKLDSNLLCATNKTIKKVLKDASRKKAAENRRSLLAKNIFWSSLFVSHIETWNFMLQTLSMDVDAEWWCVPDNFKRNPKFSIKMLKNQYKDEYWETHKEL